MNENNGIPWEEAQKLQLAWPTPTCSTPYCLRELAVKNNPVISKVIVIAIIVVLLGYILYRLYSIFGNRHR